MASRSQPCGAREPISRAATDAQPSAAEAPLAYDICCGLGGWTEGLLAEGWRVIGYDIEAHEYDGEKYPGELRLKSVLDLHGSELADADLIVASPPCQFFSYTAMPWSKAKALAAQVRADPAQLAERLAIFNACFRIQREACEAAGRYIPMVVENVRGAEPWVGRAAWSFGSYYLWGDVPALMPGAIRARKNPGFRFDGSGRSFQTESVSRHVAEGRKNGNDWFGSGQNCSLQRRAASGSKARKAASAKIAKIPFALSSHIARVYLPERTSEAA